MRTYTSTHVWGGNSNKLMFCGCFANTNKTKPAQRNMCRDNQKNSNDPEKLSDISDCVCTNSGPSGGTHSSCYILARSYIEKSIRFSMCGAMRCRNTTQLNISFNMMAMREVDDFSCSAFEGLMEPNEYIMANCLRYITRLNVRAN